MYVLSMYENYLLYKTKETKYNWQFRDLYLATFEYVFISYIHNTINKSSQTKVAQ